MPGQPNTQGLGFAPSGGIGSAGRPHRDYQAQSHFVSSAFRNEREIATPRNPQRANTEKGGRPDSGSLDPAAPTSSSRAASVCIASEA